MTKMTTTPALETRNLTLRFGGHTAVDRLSITIEPFSFKSVIGPNGAGKTTLFNLLTGQYKPTEGSVFLGGHEVTRLGPAARTRLGMGRSFQLTHLFPGLTVLENVRIAVQSRSGRGWNFWKNAQRFPEMEDEAYATLKEVVLEEKWNAGVGGLTHGEKRKLEIAVLLALNPEILFLDEPTAGMSLEEVPAILEILEKIKSKRDKTIILVEHKMDMIMSLSDSIAVLMEGKLIQDGDPHTVCQSREVQEAYLGGGTARG